MTGDKLCAYQTLRTVLLTLAKMIAPFMPFVAEDIYGNVGGGESVHLTNYPQVEKPLLDPKLEQDMDTVRHIVELARNVRNESGIKKQDSR